MRFAVAFFIFLAPIAAAAGESVEPAPSAAVAIPAPEPKTLKEKLSDKASDDQRIDNCRVPLERRGTRPRPDCATTISGPSAK